MSNTSTRTDLPALLADLSAGVFEQQLNTAISDIAANVCTHGKKGELVVKFTFKQIGDSNQVAMTHALKSVVPMARGRIIEEFAADTPLHVGRGGKLSLYPEDQTDMFKQRAEAAAAAATH